MTIVNLSTKALDTSNRSTNSPLGIFRDEALNPNREVSTLDADFRKLSWFVGGLLCCALGLAWNAGPLGAAEAATDAGGSGQTAVCLDCHDGVQKPAFHPGGWVATHALEANLRTSACEGCHDPTLFCQTCHGELSVRPGAFPSPTGEEPGNRRFHPADWGGIAGEIPTAEHHSHQARRSLETCRACHEEADCSTCHAFVSPHPKSWAEGEGWKAPGDGAVCLQCHAPGER